MSLSQSISADATEKYVLKATLEDGTVTVLWTDLTVALTKIEYTTASNSTKTGVDISNISASYQIASDAPSFKLTKNGNLIEVELTNESDYDLVKKSDSDWIEFTLKVIWVFVDGNDLLASAINSGTWTVKDENDNELSWAAASYTGNILTVKLPAEYTIEDTETLFIEIDEKTTIESNYYNVSEKSIDFRYYDATDDKYSSLIKATY
jgi:hypothetical protein